jgi:hypothetical protein
MARMFCRHNKLTSACPICSRELQAELPTAPSRVRRSQTSTSRPAKGAVSRRPGMVTKRLARAPDDGYRNPLVPGCKATADAERLAVALALATERLRPPGPRPEVAAAPDHEEGTWTAFVLVLGAEEVPSWASGGIPALPPGRAATAEAYRQWAARAGSQAAQLEGDPAWTPERRFARAYERLSLPQLTRHDRVEFLLTLAAAELYDLRPDSLFVEREDDPPTSAAKRLLVSGDRTLIDRRARDLVAATGIPFGALEHGLALWDSPRTLPEPGPLPGALTSALGLG